ncbi:MAG: MFS transporter [Actinobacteria bacterium]|nr:MFS transporter [Actinomycetota bacterium]
MNRTPLVIGSESDVVVAIDAGTARRAIKWVWILGFGGVFFEAYSGAALATGLEPLSRELNLSALQVSWVTSSYMLVAIVLCPLAGGIADRLGRIPVILAAKAIALVAMLVGTTAMGFEQLLISRLLLGVAWAMDFGVVLAYVSEFLPRRYQSRLSRWQGVWYVATTSNLLLAALIYQFGVGGSIWRWMLASAGVIAFILLGAQWLLLPESPRWLASKGRLAEASANLTKMYAVSVVPAPSAGAAPGAQPPAARGSVREILRAPYLRRTILADITFGAQAWQYFAIGWYLPVIAIVLFGEGFTQASLGAALFNSLGIVGGFAAAWLAAKLTIRRAAQIGFGFCAVLLVVFGLTLSNLSTFWAVVLPATFILVHSALAAPSGAGFSALAYPSHLRALGLGFATTSCNIGASMGLFLFPVMQEHLGPGGAVAATAAAPILGFLATTLIRWDPDRPSETCLQNRDGAGSTIDGMDGGHPIDGGPTAVGVTVDSIDTPAGQPVTSDHLK